MHREASQRQKNRALNDSVTLTEEEWDNLSGESEKVLNVSCWNRKAGRGAWRRYVSPTGLMEQAVLDLHLSGYDYREISKMLSKAAEGY